MVDFTILVVTGFALKFSDAWWVAPFSWIGMEEAWRRIIHRTAGMVLLGQSVVYGLYLLFARQGRRELKAMLPRLKDGRDLGLNLRFYLGLSPRKPGFDRYNYIDKSEFWAVVWGVVIMGATGLILWLPEQATALFPSWIVNISEIIHYYEAWLATLAILVWHFFYVIFYPGEYPLNLTCVDGRITEEEWAAHHPEEYERERADTEGPNREKKTHGR